MPLSIEPIKVQLNKDSERIKEMLEKYKRPITQAEADETPEIDIDIAVDIMDFVQAIANASITKGITKESRIQLLTYCLHKLDALYAALNTKYLALTAMELDGLSHRSKRNLAVMQYLTARNPDNTSPLIMLQNDLRIELEKLGVIVADREPVATAPAPAPKQVRRTSAAAPDSGIRAAGSSTRGLKQPDRLTFGFGPDRDFGRTATKSTTTADDTISVSSGSSTSSSSATSYSSSSSTSVSSGTRSEKERRKQEQADLEYARALAAQSGTLERSTRQQRPVDRLVQHASAGIPARDAGGDFVKGKRPRHKR